MAKLEAMANCQKIFKLNLYYPKHNFQVKIPKKSIKYCQKSCLYLQKLCRPISEPNWVTYATCSDILGNIWTLMVEIRQLTTCSQTFGLI